jgi:large exoprotein involved in heme utilization and adhesion
VISRVTGNNPSVIDGTLKSDIKNADFYFINPHGITFNSNAQVDVPAAFHVSTADKMDFGKNGGVFYADVSKDSQLSSEPPSAFGFLGNSPNNSNGLVDINNAHLNLRDGKTFDVVSGGISIEGKVDDFTRESLESTVNSRGGDVRLVAFTGQGNVGLQLTDAGFLPLPSENSTEYGGVVSINGGYVDTSGDGAGRIAVYGGNVVITSGRFAADNIGNTQADENKGINIQTNNLYLNNGHISSSANNPTDDNSNPLFIAKGNAGNITISANNAVKLIGIPQNIYGGYNGSIIESSTSSDGNAGVINITTKELELLSSNC